MLGKIVAAAGAATKHDGNVLTCCYVCSGVMLAGIGRLLSGSWN